MPGTAVITAARRSDRAGQVVRDIEEDLAALDSLAARAAALAEGRHGCGEGMLVCLIARSDGWYHPPYMPDTCRHATCGRGMGLPDAWLDM